MRALHPPDTHEPLDSQATDPMTARRERPMHTRAPIRAAAALDDPLHSLEKSPVLSPTCALGPLPPGVVAGPRHAIQGAQPRHAHRPPVRVDECERLALCSEQNRMAFF